MRKHAKHEVFGFTRNARVTEYTRSKVILRSEEQVHQKIMISMVEGMATMKRKKRPKKKQKKEKRRKKKRKITGEFVGISQEDFNETKIAAATIHGDRSICRYH